MTDNLTGADYSDLLASGRYDMGHIGTPPLFDALVRTSECAIVGQGLVRYVPFYLLTRPGIRSARDLCGATVALTKKRTCVHSVLLTILRRHDVAPEDVALTLLADVPPILRAIETERVDGVVIWEPYASHIERAYGWRLLADGPIIVKPSNYGFQIFARRSLVTEHADVAKSFLESYSDCVDYAKSHVDVAIASCPVLAPITIEDVARSVRREAPLWSSDTSLDHMLLERVVAEMKEQQALPADYRLSDHIASLA